MRRAIVAVLACACAACAGLFGLGAVLGDTSPASAAFHAVTGYWSLGAPILLVAAAAARSWRSAGVAAVLTVAWLARVAPGVVPRRPSPEGVPLRLVSANVLMVNPEPAAFLEEVFAGSPDVVVLEEYSPRFVGAAERYRAEYPHQVQRPEFHSFGEAVFSRLPLESVVEDDAGAPVLDVVVRVGGRRVRILVVHTLPPIDGDNVALWSSELRWLAARADAIDPDEALIVAGDLNATRHHPSLRRLLADGGLRDAHAEVGRATAKTWPNGRFWFPPLQLDHVLLRGPIRAVSVREGEGRGSDHRPILTDLRVAPVGPP